MDLFGLLARGPAPQGSPLPGFGTAAWRSWKGVALSASARRRGERVLVCAGQRVQRHMVTVLPGKRGQGVEGPRGQGVKGDNLEI
jgi:hypothetical protein